MRARFLARRRVAVGRRAILMMPKREAPDHDTVGKHVAVAGGQSHVLADAGEPVGRHPKFKQRLGSFRTSQRVEIGV